ncbi:MAG TPA: IS3 family transposase [Polyangiaceae bacterium]|nr:IS3 family transposase [Polyangiaceae bacterium]
MARRKRRNFTPEFKAEAVRLTRLGDRSIGKVALDLDLTEGALREWVKRAEADAGNAAPETLTTAEREELTRLRRDNKRLQMERDILKGSGHVLREGKRMKFAFIAAEEVAFPVIAMCRMLDVSPSGYYAWKMRPEPVTKAADVKLALAIAGAHGRSRGIYGSPRVHRDLKARGLRIGKKRVERLMRENGLRGRCKRRFVHTTDSKHALPIAPNVLERCFTVAAPNRTWVGDVTFIATDDGWLYLAVLLDLFSRRVVGWATSANNDRALALAALEQAIRQRRPLPGLVQHTDRGSPYASDDYRAALAQQGIVASMSRTGDCYDNAVAESFFATLKAEHVDHENFPSREVAHASIGDYIEGFYNTARRHSSIGYVSPLEFELRSHVAALAA